MNEIIILSSLGFIFGWLLGRINYKKKLLQCIEDIRFEGKSNNKHFTAGMERGIDALRIYLTSLIKENKVGKPHSIHLGSNKDLLSKKNNKD